MRVPYIQVAALTIASVLATSAQTAANDLARTITPEFVRDVGDELPYYPKVERLAREHGWTCVYREGDKQRDAFVYTVGLGGKHLPDLVIETGESAEDQCALANLIARKLIAHGPPIPDDFEALGPHVLRLNRIYADEFFHQCILAQLWDHDHGVLEGAYGMQAVFPDKNGAYPN